MEKKTKDIIKDTFIALLESRPLAQISVKDIVEACGINRNTFYYHYADLPSLIEDIILIDTEKIISEYHEFSSIGDCVRTLLAFTLEHKKLALHLYNSSNRDIFIQYFMQISDHVLSEYFEMICRDRNIRPGDRELLIHYYKCMIFGQTVDWIRNGMTTDIIAQFDRFFELYEGIPEEIIRRCEQK